MLNYDVLFFVLLTTLKLTNTATTFYKPPEDGEISLREAIDLLQQLIEQSKDSREEIKDGARLERYKHFHNGDFSPEYDSSLSFETPSEDWKLEPVQIIGLDKSNLKYALDFYDDLNPKVSRKRRGRHRLQKTNNAPGMEFSDVMSFY